jgi:endonuclease/exonuclease/phosphatase family metal-dependent hydrolase
LLAERIAARRTPGEPVVVTGDFNVGEANPALKRLTAPLPSAPALFVDTFRVRYPAETRVGTFNGFKFEQTGGEKIDYVLVLPGTDVLDAAIIRTSRNNRYPSDHFPVTARVVLPR